MQIWAGRAELDEARRYTGELSLLRASDPRTGGVLHLEVLAADPMVTASAELVEGYLNRGPAKLLDVLRIDTTDGPLVYIVRGIDTQAALYFLSWPD